MDMIKLTLKQARRFMLLRHGLIGEKRFEGKQGAYDYVRSVGCVQFDPIDVCGRNAELVLQSRVKGFTKNMLHELLYVNRTLVDYYDKVMSIFPVEDWPFFERTRKRNVDDPYSSSDELKTYINLVREYIAANGPMTSSDIESDKKIRWPWGYSPIVRAALETLYFQGELIIYQKRVNRKQYDFAQRHISPQYLLAQDPNQTLEEYQAWHVRRRTDGVGLMWNRPSDAFLEIIGLNAASRTQAYDALLKSGDIIELQVEGIRWPLYMDSSKMELLEIAMTDQELMPRCEFLAPLDNIMWDRKLIEALFGYYYRWEIYTPAAKRQYGYYVLPILYGEELIGRIEPAYDKQAKALTIRNVWYEPGKKLPKKTLDKAISAFERFHKAD